MRPDWDKGNGWTRMDGAEKKSSWKKVGHNGAGGR